MAVIKCKMCGGDLVFEAGSTVAECEYCGSKQTIPTQDNEKKLTLFSRANRLRMNSEFDKAFSIYESIVAEFPEEAEAYWGLVLCKYGIEYVDDPATGKKIPTCHRSSFESVMEDPDLEQAVENADVLARRVYREEAKQIEEIRKDILEVSGKEEPYDIFICYKETDENGDRTIDSVIAQDVYDALTEKGYRVFFSRISLEDKLGQEYEPYIFAALNSAKIMLAFGTDYEYYNAVWVKNEWSRYLKLMAKDKSKHLIPCYKNIDAYDMPKEFAKLQAQDMGKVGAVQDLLRGIEKILGGKKENAVAVAAPMQSSANSDQNSKAFLERGFMSLEDGAFDEAKGFFNEVLNTDPKCADAYLGLFMADAKAKNIQEAGMAFVMGDYTANRYWQRAKQFAKESLLVELTDWEEKRQYYVSKKEDERRRQEEKSQIARQEQIKKLSEARKRMEQCRFVISAGSHHVVGLKSDGTVVAVGSDEHGQCEVKYWTDIVAVSAGVFDTVGLKSNGTMIKRETRDQNWWTESCYWTDIVAVSAGFLYTVGLKSDGTVVAVGCNEDGQCDVEQWTDIKAVCGSYDHTVGLKADGTVVAVGRNEDGQCDVSSWTDIAALSAGDRYTVGLKTDGTVVAVGINIDGQCDLGHWRDIVAVSAGSNHVVGLKSDGTVVAAGNDYRGKCDVDHWTDIVAVSAGGSLTVGLKSDGTVVAVGEKRYRENIESWKLCDNPLTFMEELQRKKLECQRMELEKELSEHQEKLDSFQSQMTSLNESQQKNMQAMETAKTEFSTLKGLFTSKRRKELQNQITDLEANENVLITKADYIKADIVMVESNITELQKKIYETQKKITDIGKQ